MRPYQVFLLILGIFIFSHPTFAAHGRYEEAMRVRGLLEIPQESIAPEDVAERYVLPVSRGFSQEGTELCWVYATLNALESIFLARNESQKNELSRRTMQYFTFEDRYLRYIKGIENYLSERGVAVDAIRLIQAGGLVAFRDYKDIVDPYGDADITRDVDHASTSDQKIQILYTDLDIVYSRPPNATHFDDTPISREGLAKQFLGNQVWESYAAASSGEEGYRRHPDPDARQEAVSWYMPRSKFAQRIKAALKANYAVEVTIGGHCIMLYGAEYDSNGTPLHYYMKDSYPDYFYTANPAKLHETLIEISTVKILSNME